MRGLSVDRQRIEEVVVGVLDAVARHSTSAITGPTAALTDPQSDRTAQQHSTAAAGSEADKGATQLSPSSTWRTLCVCQPDGELSQLCGMELLSFMSDLRTNALFSTVSSAS